MTEPRDKTILVAEDDPASRELIGEILRGCGYAVLEARDGAAALEVLDRLHPDLVVVDIQMPTLDGYAVLRHLRRSRPMASPLPIVAVTAHAMAGDRERALQAGFDDYLTKPIQPTHLRQRVAALLQNQDL